MKLLIIGQSVEDHIYQSGEVLLKPGGIYYSLTSLVNIADNEDEIFLCTSVEKQKEKLFPSYQNVNRSYLNYTDTLPVVHLTIHNDRERDERYENLNNPLKIDTGYLNEFDGIYINMVTGFDISIEQAENIRRNFKGPVYIDIHTLSRGYDEEGKRMFRLIPDASRWIKSADIIQVNESELFTLSTLKDPEEIIDEVLSSGLKYLIVTMGDKGAAIHLKENNQVKSVKISAIKINTLNKVGCGDVFGAVYFYYYIKNKDIFEALKMANIAAGLTASYNGFNEFNRLKEDVLSRYN